VASTTKPKQSKTIDLAVRASCELRRRDGGTLEFRFPERSGYLTPARWEFRDRQELVDYLARLLSLEVTGGGLRGTGVCYGKYERRSADGGRAFCFGDPLLDLITDPGGQLVLGGRRIDLAAIELQSPRYRAGGIRSIELAPLSGALRDLQVAQAALGQGDFTLIEHTPEVVGLASTNPSQRDFYLNGHHLRFRAWKKNYALYWSMGAEIETWGHDFTSARIESRYLDTVAGAFCAAVKVDSDSDTNDDYVDEYEWGVNAPQPLRVVSNCGALWHGQNFGGQVEAGPPCSEVF
jgi:hypothetical protein